MGSEQWGTVTGEFFAQQELDGVAVPLSGRMVLGAGTDGANGTSATVGEVAIFGAALTDDQVAGLQRALTRKWS